MPLFIPTMLIWNSGILILYKPYLSKPYPIITHP